MRSLLTVLVVVLAATSAWLWHALGQEREQADQLKAEVARARAGGPRDVALPVPVESSPARVVEEDDHEYFDPTRFKRGLIFSGRDPRLLQNGDYMEARRRYLEAAFSQRYPDLTRVLKVSEATALRVVELSHEEQMRESGVTVEATDRPDFWLEQQQKAYESDTAIAALIGDTKLQQWKEYEASIWERHQARQLRLELMDSAEPLEGDKSEALIHTLYAERQSMEQEARAISGSTGDEPGGPSFAVHQNAAEFEAESERRTLKAAEKLLSSYQFETFRKMVERQRIAQSAMEEMERVGMEALK